MGCGTLVSCPKCRVTIDCGYGSYRTFDRRAAAALEEHEEHGAVSWSRDYTYYEGNNLHLIGAWGGDGEVLVEDEKTFERVKGYDYD